MKTTIEKVKSLVSYQYTEKDGTQGWGNCQYNKKIKSFEDLQEVVGMMKKEEPVLEHIMIINIINF
jgi:hypothetical protein